MEHIKAIGPHPHQWTMVRAGNGWAMRECALCGTRQLAAHPDARAPAPPAYEWQRPWLAGGDLPADPAPAAGVGGAAPRVTR
jgi:hypothetical protein